jgi:phosphoribosylaminoimidazole carboxylase PurE protein
MLEESPRIQVGILFGSESDRPVMATAASVLEKLGIGHEMLVASAHRTPDRVTDYARMARSRGIQVIIAGAGMAAALPGVVASLTSLPVIGVPLVGSSLGGLDSLLSIVQMPPGVPVATVALGEAGAKNAAYLAAEILALADPEIAGRLADVRARMAEGQRV